ncbi:hypothetical protein GP486_004796 [Trichoglossum hirsutum]|uniref:Alpha-galactosidase n=1 Tax=Trichoglossum hirsutum TaxID=265104 RepID=A0A9P8LAN8_9PEZI|nr:hypothetical protein GP486_004796 [Trichoglossum hirsutum]
MPRLWSGSRIGGVDGRIVFTPPPPLASSGLTSVDERCRLPLQFSDIFESDLDAGALFDVTPVDEDQSQQELDLVHLNVNVWHVTSPLSRIFCDSDDADKSKDGRKQVVELPLGRAILPERWMALAKLATPWMGPIHSGSAAGGGGGGSTFTTTKECLLLLIQRRDGRHVAILPLSGVPSGEGAPTASSYVTSSHASERMYGEKGRDGIIWRIYDESPSGGGRLGSAKCIVVAGMDTKNVIKGAMSWAEFIVKRASHLGNVPSTKQSVASEEKGEGPFSQPSVPYGGVTHDTLTGRGLYLMHDGLTYCTWNSLGLNLSGERILNALKKLHETGIRVCNVIIDDNWQTLDNARYTSSGTWTAYNANPNFDSVGGLSGLVKEIRNKYLYIRNVGVWHALHGYWDGITPGGEIDGIYKSVDCTWRDNVHQQERSLRFIDPIDVERFYDDFYRTSDDFYPNVPESHGWHVFVNSMNMTMFSHLNIVPDWDMFQTALPRYAGFHAAARCLSGGPVVITDTPGDHDIGLIQQMTATTPDGDNITLRPTTMAVPSDPYMSYTSLKLLRITSSYLRGSNRTGSEVVSFIGLFNISTVCLRDLFCLSDFDGPQESSHYITRSYRSGHITPPVAYNEANDTLLTLHLKPGAWDILTAVPVIRLIDSSSEVMCYVGTFGLSTNMTGAAAVTDTNVVDVPNDNESECGVSIRYSLSVLGTLLGDLYKRLQIDMCGLALHTDDGYWRVHPDHNDVVEISVDRAYENLSPRITSFGHPAPLTVGVVLYGTRQLSKGTGDA